MRPVIPALATAIAALALASAATCGVIVVDPAGGGNFDNIPEAMFRGSADDTVLVLPGFYEVEAGIPHPWPIPLTADSPTLVSQGGAAVTLILGMLLRNFVFDRGTATSFIVVAGAFLFATLVGWRALLAGFDAWRARRA